MTTLSIKDWNIETITGYKPITTYYTDFSIAEHFGIDAIKETFNDALKHNKNDVHVLTELCMVMNWKCWEHKKGDLLELYIDLYEAINNYCVENFTGEDLKYFYRTTD